MDDSTGESDTGRGVSIRSLLAALCLTLVVVSAGISAWMSITTGERALNDVKDASAQGLEKCFAKGGANVEDVARRLVAMTIKDTESQVLGFFSLPVTLATELIYLISRTPPDITTDPEWLEGTLQYQINAMARMSAPRGISSILYQAMPISKKAALLGRLGGSKWGGAVMSNMQYCPILMWQQCLQNASRAGRDEDECSSLKPDGSEYKEEDMHLLSVTMRDWETGRIGTNRTHIHIGGMNWDGSVDRSPCAIQSLDTWECGTQTGYCVVKNTDETWELQAEINGRAVLNLDQGPLIAPNMPTWSPAHALGLEVTTVCFFAISHPDGLSLGPITGPRVGFGVLSMPNDFVSAKFRRIALPSTGSRLFAVERNPWTNQSGTLTGATHGITARRVGIENLLANSASDKFMYVMRPIHVLNSSDSVIREHAEWVRDNYAGDYGGLARGSGDEDWNSQAGVLYWQLTRLMTDGYGLAWYLTLLAPRNEVLATIDEAIETIKNEIAQTNKDADDKKEEGFTVMIIVVACAAIVLMSVALWSTVQITKPLGVLEGQMSEVALMRLSAVDDQRQLSKLGEVRSMQISFFQMVGNLKEFRSYMPQSVLCVTEHGADGRNVPAPTGKLCLVFTDIVGSTKLWETSPETMEDALHMHNDIMRKVMLPLGGYEVKTIGDAFMVAFADPVCGVLFGVGVQEELLEARWPEDPDLEEIHDKWALQRAANGDPVWNGIAVRIGVSYGDIQDETNPITGRTDYRGPNVNLAARLESSAPHGAVQLSQDCFKAVSGDSRLGSLTFTPRAGLELKGIGTVDTVLVMSVKLSARLALILQQWRAEQNTLDREIIVAPKRQSRSSRGMEESSSRGSQMSRGSRAVMGRRSSGGYAPGQQAPSRLDNALKFAQVPGGVAVILGNHNVLGASALDAAMVCRLINKSVLAILMSATRTQGKVEAVVGDQAHVGWNIIQGCSLYQTQPLMFAATLATGGQGVAIGVATGQLLHGSVGSQKQRFHTTVGLPAQVAEAGAAEARRLHCTCLASFSPELPPALAAHMSPVDTWAVTRHSADSERVTIWRPALERIYGAKRDDWTAGGDEFAEGSEPAGEGEKEVSTAELYHDALLRGSTEALARFEERAQGDEVQETVAARLRQHVAAHPEGHSFRIQAPFIIPSYASRKQELDLSVLQSQAFPSRQASARSTGGPTVEPATAPDQAMSS